MQLLSKTARGDIGGQEEVKAAILLGSKGVDLPRIQQQLQSLTRCALLGFVTPCAYVSGFCQIKQLRHFLGYYLNDFN